MENIFGTLSIIGINSFLMPQKFWLLRIGFPDAGQAGLAATNLIKNVLGLRRNTPVVVTGTRNSIGSQPIIIMSEINAAGSLIREMAQADSQSGLLINPEELHPELLLDLQPKMPFVQAPQKRPRKQARAKKPVSKRATAKRQHGSKR